MNCDRSTSERAGIMPDLLYILLVLFLIFGILYFVRRL